MEPLRSLNLEYFFYQIYNLLTGVEASVPEEVSAAWLTIQNIAVVLSVLFVIGIIYTTIRIWQIEEEVAEEEPSVWAAAVSAPRVQKNERWERVRQLSASDNPSDWRLAILEADILLDGVVSSMGYRGDNVGEKLKSIEPSDFPWLNDAWDAHKVRNQLAHAGSDFILTARETRRVIDIYEKIFRACKFI